MAVFHLLRYPNNYTPCEWDLIADPVGRDHWVREFTEHTDSLITYAEAQPSPPTSEQIQAFREDSIESYARFKDTPDARGRLDVLEFCILRDELILKHNIGDPYATVKAQANEEAIQVYPRLIEELDETPEPLKIELLLSGVLAGNRFDLGAAATDKEFRSGRQDFFMIRDSLTPRPWWKDSVNELTKAFSTENPGYKKAMLFADNAGADIVLGMIPLARHLANAGTRIALAATDHFALNDITYSELLTVIDQLRSMDPLLDDLIKQGQLSFTGTGYTHPLMDLEDISEACNEAARDCDLILLEGMGRAIESNFQTAFTCDCLRVAMIKNPAVADYIGCNLFDLVCELENGEYRDLTDL